MKDGNPPSLAPLLSFMQKFIHLQGSKVELGSRNDAANGPVQIVAKELMLMSYEAVRSCGASRDHDVSQGMTSPMLTRYRPARRNDPLFYSASRGTANRLEKSFALLSKPNIILSSIRFLKELVIFLWLTIG